MKRILLSFGLFAFGMMSSQDIPFDKLYGNSDPIHYYLGHYPVANADGLDINWYGGIKLQSSAGVGIQLLRDGNVGIGTSTPIQKLDVWGNILAGNTNSTEGINALAIRYEDGSINNWGALRSSSSTYMSFGVKANGSGFGWLSSNGTLDWTKTAITLDNEGISFLMKSQQQIALNSPVIMTEVMKISPNGNALLQGKFEAREIKVTLTPTADFVFNENYNLPKLEEVEKHIKEKKHLPEIASAAQMEKEGVNIGEFQIKLLQKIEELTLYSIEQNKQLKSQTKEIEMLKKLMLNKQK
ncbi:hypothetical protein [Chryseobacterium herbae]|uniref:Uncharacterized protein n=1 Tax=Chryseobacterium herbae TaxID=2976476 RepID=A0ABT2IVG0_9FLAO|nr:hypothetical protein [Chryseobacterium sp. pc1-10]MCT2562831.1 hypothetical protein [Chryseobacterium sp. pc1-10]